MCTPVQNAESDLFLWARTRKSQDPERTVQIFERLPAQGVSDAKEWDNFLVCGLLAYTAALCLTHEQKTKEKPTKSKKLENKATRWPENKLLDEIAKCFSQHKYWSIKAFRGSIPQPEAYLRETLDKIAVLHRTGTFANHWSLKPEYQSMVASLPKPADDAAVTKAELPSDDEDEEDIKMEDVL
jgi:transcription initiation factor TFIIF subunit beta